MNDEQVYKFLMVHSKQWTTNRLIILILKYKVNKYNNITDWNINYIRL